MKNMERDTTPQDIEREAEASRRRLSSTLDELRDNLTPAHVVEELLDGAKDGGASMLRALGTAARDNPIPALLIGTGCAMFLMGASSGGTARAAARRHEGRSDAHARDDAVMATVSDGLASARESVAGAASEIGERAKRVAEGVSETYQAYADVAIDGATQATHKVKETVARSTGKVRENVATLLNEQPLVLGAIGVAVGAAIGALLPRTTAEDGILGETSDALKGSAAQLASEQYERAKQTATQVVEDVREIAGARGLTTESAAEVVGEVGRRVKAAAGMESRA